MLSSSFELLFPPYYAKITPRETLDVRRSIEDKHCYFKKRRFDVDDYLADDEIDWSNI